MWKRRDSFALSLLLRLLLLFPWFINYPYAFTVLVFPTLLPSNAFSVQTTKIFVHTTRRGWHVNDSITLFLSNRNDSSGQSKTGGKNGYRFGDFTRGAINRLQSRVNSLTGKSDYTFGDLSRWLDKKAKERVENFTNKPTYQFGDISKEIVGRLVNGKYDHDDLLLLLKIVTTVGINMQPVARILPMKVLMDLLNLSLEASIAQTVGEKVITSISKEIDARMKEMLTGDRDYQFGDNIITRWTGKKKYEFGDVTKTILGQLQDREDNIRLGRNASTTCETRLRTEESSTNKVVLLELEKTDQDALEAWDKQFLLYHRKKEGIASLQDNDVYRDWDERYLSSQGDSERND
jgi:hypothetical protein